MNTNQRVSLQDMARQFLARANHYLDQADVCYDELEASTNRLARYLEDVDSDNGDRYHELAQKLFRQVDDILDILEKSGHKEDLLADLSAAARNTSALVEAVQASRKSGSFKAVEV